MRRASVTIFYLLVSLVTLLSASDIKLIEPSEAIRLIGNRSVVFVSADDNESYRHDHIMDSANIPAVDIHYHEHHGLVRYVAKSISLGDANVITKDRRVLEDQSIILYDTFDGVNASGLYSFFEMLGHKEIQILNGGLESIRVLDPNQKLYDKLRKEFKDIKEKVEDKKEEMESELREDLLSNMDALHAKMLMIEPSLLTHSIVENEEKKSRYQLKGEPKNFKYIATTQAMQKALKSIQKKDKKSHFILIDTRDKSQRERGQIENSLAISSRNFTDFVNKKSFRSPLEIGKIAESFGLKKEDRLYLYSDNSARRASHVALALRMAGYTNVKIYAEGWSGWSDHNGTKVDLGFTSVP